MSSFTYNLEEIGSLVAHNIVLHGLETKGKTMSGIVQ